MDGGLLEIFATLFEIVKVEILNKFPLHFEFEVLGGRLEVVCLELFDELVDEVGVFGLLLYGGIDIIDDIRDVIIFVSEGESEVGREVGGGLGLL